METNPSRKCELLVGLPGVNDLNVDDLAGEPLRVKVEGRVETRLAGLVPRVRDAGVDQGPTNADVELVDLPCFGRPTRSSPMIQGVQGQPLASGRS